MIQARRATPASRIDAAANEIFFESGYATMSSVIGTRADIAKYRSGTAPVFVSAALPPARRQRDVVARAQLDAVVADAQRPVPSRM